ncbi:MAG: family 20 glycosylhydrolase [Bacteroidia bacterium]|nr:family 20 glycosylhydrolase [Bacteroidia bacterium]
MKKTNNFILILLLTLWCQSISIAQESSEKLFPIKGFAIAAPKSKDVDRFVKFINEELATRGVNALLLRVDFNYQFESYPQLRDSAALSKADIKKMVDVCKKNNIKIIPQINLLGHQSWHSKTTNLLLKFPEFDETPHVKMPEKYSWPNSDGLYCKSYCPLHPGVHTVVFALVDEICDAFQAEAFHAGMDEVFYIGDDKCPRCAGIDKAELFGGEVTRIRNHLAEKKRELWIWGDRLIDGKATGMGIWEASFNNTHRAIDMIPKDVVICDWHYERPDQTAVYFAMKGFRVLTCPWRTPQVAVLQTEDMARFRKYATKEMKPRYHGMMQTVWSGPDSFMDGFYGILTNNSQGDVSPKNTTLTPWDTFRAMYKKMDELAKMP